jgi:hypothetical protein
MVGPLEALPVGLAAVATEVQKDVDGRPPRGVASGSSSVYH